MSNICTISTAVLNQWALDFLGNRDRILKSIYKAKKVNAKYRGGPELEVCGYGCADHFYESDTLLHSWEVLRDILQDKKCYDIILDIGMPVGYRGGIYNCRIICLNGKILLIRPKQILASKAVFREDRWFNNWNRLNTIEELLLPSLMQDVTGQKYVPIGDALLCLNDTVIGIETCEEMWVQEAPNIRYVQQGAELVFNGNCSNHVLRKLDERLSLIEAATRKSGGVYVYTNMRGCDSERVYYDGGAMVALNGAIVAQGAQFSLEDVELLTATVDLDEVRTYRHLSSHTCRQTSDSPVVPRIQIDFWLTDRGTGGRNGSNSVCLSRPLSRLQKPVRLSPAQEVSLAPALWLWDQLRRGSCSGFFLPLSGGLDSASVACLVHSLCVMLVSAVKTERIASTTEDQREMGSSVLADVRRVVRDPEYEPRDPRELCSRLLVTCYMASEHSSSATRSRASALADQVGATHLSAAIDTVVAALLLVATVCLGLGSNRKPRFKSQGGTRAENLALQNVQARVRMVLAYLLAQLYHWSRSSDSSQKTGGGLLVLASGNLDECLRGYLTKYDCSSADLNPIGSICKTDLRMLARHCITEFGLTSLREIVEAPPTAELEPLDPASQQLVQTDEVDMGMTYEELSVFGKLRKLQACGPYSMFLKMLEQYRRSDTALAASTEEMTAQVDGIAEKVRHFFRCYSQNRHKMTVITPAYHVEAYDCDDNRFDLRPFLYNTAWSWQFAAIDRLVREYGPCVVTATTLLEFER